MWCNDTLVILGSDYQDKHAVLIILTAYCRSGIDKADIVTSRTLIWKLEAARQATSFNEQKHAAYLELEYDYLHFNSSLVKARSDDKVSALEIENFGAYEDPYAYNGHTLYPQFLTKVMMAYQQPIFNAQKRFLSTLM